MKKVVLTVIFSSFILAGCGKKAAMKFPPRHVDVLVVSPYNVPYVLDYPGNVSGVADFPVVARVGGVIQKQVYKEGTPVKKGQVLYQIDPGPYEANLKADQGQLIKDSDQVVQYKSILDRYQRLYKINAVSLQDIETATINYKNAVGQTQTDQGNIDNDKLNIKYCKVEAPTDGLISERVVTVGTMVVAWQTVLTYINSGNNMYINFSVPENDRLNLQQGILSGKIYIPNNFTFNINLELADGTMLNNAGIIRFFDTRISLDNGTWNMRADVSNKELRNKLLSGQFVHVYLLGASFKNAIAIPQAAVFRDDKGAFVYVVVSGDKIEKRQVETGMMTGQLWVINSGLNANDKVVVDGGLKVMAGDKVIIDSTKDQAKILAQNNTQNKG